MSLALDFHVYVHVDVHVLGNVFGNGDVFV